MCRTILPSESINMYKYISFLYIETRSKNTEQPHQHYSKFNHRKYKDSSRFMCTYIHTKKHKDYMMDFDYWNYYDA